MADKKEIQRLMDKALEGQSMKDALDGVREEVGQHKDDINAGFEELGDHAKKNKLLNVLQTGEMIMNLGRDKEARDVTISQQNFQESTKKHNAGAQKSRSRIEGGIKDIKDMMGGEGEKVPQTERLADIFGSLVGGKGVGNNKQEMDANNIMASFAGQYSTPEQINELSSTLASASKEDREAFTDALNAIADAGAGKKDLTDEKVTRLTAAADKLGIQGIDTSTKMFAVANKDPEKQKVMKAKFKEFRTMADEGRILKPGKGEGRSGVDTESIPEQNHEVLTDIYDLLEKWYNQMLGDGGNGNSGSSLILPAAAAAAAAAAATKAARVKAARVAAANAAANRPPAGTARPVASSARGTAARVNTTDLKAKSGRFYPADSTQGRAIANATPKPIKPSMLSRAQAGTARVMNSPAMKVVSKVAVPLTAALAVVKEGLEMGNPFSDAPTTGDLGEIENRAKLDKDDDRFLDEEQKQVARTAEIGEGTVGAFGTVAGGIGGAKAGVAIGAIGGPIGMAIGGLIGGVTGAIIGNFAGRSSGRALSGLEDNESLDSAVDSGLYNKDWFGDSEIDKTKISSATTSQLQAILQDGDIDEGNIERITDELAKRRAGDIAMNEDGSVDDLTALSNLEPVMTPTGDGIANTQEQLALAEEQKDAVAINNKITNNNSVVNNTSKPEVIVTSGLDTSNKGSMLRVGNRNAYV